MEVLNQLEKVVNLTTEGIDVASVIYTGSDGKRTTASTLTAPLLSNLKDFLTEESNVAKNSLWDTVSRNASNRPHYIGVDYVCMHVCMYE